ncbi:hypothetical protein [Streptomyces sp. NPDC005969]|uniref:hypothetical protein n=1 Tax=Streptomyces sp. NPDC005969 TaxID=3156722 RepID=UPI00340173F8
MRAAARQGGNADFPAFAAWLDAVTVAFTASEPPSWFGELGSPGFHPDGVH